MNEAFRERILEVKQLLQADDKQMAKHLRLSAANYSAIVSGARVLPLPTRRTLEKRMEALLKRCGLK